MAVDIVQDFLTRLQQHLPEQVKTEQPQLLHRLEADLRLTWGGTERNYVRRRLSANNPFKAKLVKEPRRA